MPAGERLQRRPPRDQLRRLALPEKDVAPPSKVVSPRLDGFDLRPKTYEDTPGTQASNVDFSDHHAARPDQLRMVSNEAADGAVTF
jgi:hypothetical protein